MLVNVNQLLQISPKEMRAQVPDLILAGLLEMCAARRIFFKPACDPKQERGAGGGVYRRDTWECVHS